MIARIAGKLVQKHNQALILNVHGLFYEIMVPTSVMNRIEETTDEQGCVNLVTYHYLQIGPSGGVPVLIGFMNEIERDFFLQFIKVSGIGPRPAVKALTKPISEITRAIHEGNRDYLKTLPGIGMQKAKEIIAKLQGKMGKFGLIQDKETASAASEEAPASQRGEPDWQEEAMEVLLRLQYKRAEAGEMIRKALGRSGEIRTTEALLNEIYNQKIRHVV